MTDAQGANFADLSWLIDGFANNTTGVSHAVVISTDGLLLYRSRQLPQDPAEQLAAVTAGLLSLTQGAARLFEAGAVMQTMVQMEQGFLLLAAVGDRACLAVLAARHCDTAAVGHQMVLLVAQLGTHLTPEIRAQPDAHAIGNPAAART